tara:strand:+ start:589 stop:1392 length:804 start_codon:yes stop_codon:yes gene_type:complete
MKNNPLISIIITNYNKSKFIIKGVKSCLNQKYKEIEIIFFDDNSSDDSLKKIKDFKKKNEINLKIISNQKKKNSTSPINQMIAVNKSLKYVKGKFIFLLDSDDFFHKKKFFDIVRIFERDDKKKLIIDLPIFKYKKKEIKKNYKNISFKNKWPKFPPTSCMSFETKTLKKVIKKINFKKYPNLAIDFFLAVYYYVILKNFYIHKSHLTYYRQLTNGTDSIYLKYRTKKWWIRRKEAFEFLNDLLVKNRLPVNKGLDFSITNFLNKIL